MTDQIPPIPTQPILPNPVIVAMEDPEVDNPIPGLDMGFKAMMKLLPFWKKLLALSPSLSNLFAIVLLLIFIDHPVVVAWIATSHIIFICVLAPLFFFGQFSFSGMNMIRTYILNAFRTLIPQPRLKQSEAKLLTDAHTAAFQAGVNSFGIQMAMAAIFCVVIYGPRAMDYISIVSGRSTPTTEERQHEPKPSIVINNYYIQPVKKETSPPSAIPPKKHHSSHGLPSHKSPEHCPSHIPTKE